MMLNYAEPDDQMEIERQLELIRVQKLESVRAKLRKAIESDSMCDDIISCIEFAHYEEKNSKADSLLTALSISDVDLICHSDDEYTLDCIQEEIRDQKDIQKYEDYYF